MTLRFLFDILHFECVHRRVRDSVRDSREKLPKNVSKNGDARSGLWAPACTRFISLSLQGFQVIQYKK